MENKTIISRQELSKRWGLSVSKISDIEANGSLTRLDFLKSPYYALSDVMRLEKFGGANEYEDLVNRLDMENREFKREIKRLKCLYDSCSETLRKLLEVKLFDGVSSYDEGVSYDL